MSVYKSSVPEKLLFIWLCIYLSLTLLGWLVFLVGIPFPINAIIGYVFTFLKWISLFMFPLVFRNRVFKIVAYIAVGITVIWGVAELVRTILSVIKYF